MNIDNPSTEIMKEQTYEDLYLIIEKLALKRRTGSDNLISKAGKKASNQQKNSQIPSNLNSPQNNYLTPENKTPQNLHFPSNYPSQNKIQSMNLLSSQKPQNHVQMSLKNLKTKGMKTIDNPEILGAHKATLSKLSSSDKNFAKKIIFTEPGMDFSEEEAHLHLKKHSKFSNIPAKKQKIKSEYDKNKSMTNFLKPNHSTGITSNSRPTKPTEEDFDSDDISEGKNCETSCQELKNVRENYLAEGGFDYELIEKMNELSDGVKYTFGGVGISKEGEEYHTKEEEEEEKKDGEYETEMRNNMRNTNFNNLSMRELNHVIFFFQICSYYALLGAGRY